MFCISVYFTKETNSNPLGRVGTTSVMRPNNQPRGLRGPQHYKWVDSYYIRDYEYPLLTAKPTVGLPYHIPMGAQIFFGQILPRYWKWIKGDREKFPTTLPPMAHLTNSRVDRAFTTDTTTRTTTRRTTRRTTRTKDTEYLPAERSVRTSKQTVFRRQAFEKPSTKNTVLVKQEFRKPRPQTVSVKTVPLRTTPKKPPLQRFTPQKVTSEELLLLTPVYQTIKTRTQKTQKVYGFREYTDYVL